MDIATTTWNQISLNTKMACGARNPKSDGNTLIFQVTIEPGKRHWIQVTLEWTDTYKVELVCSKGTTVTTEKTCAGVYNDQLSKIIYDFCNTNYYRRFTH